MTTKYLCNITSFHHKFVLVTYLLNLLTYWR